MAGGQRERSPGRRGWSGRDLRAPYVRHGQVLRVRVFKPCREDAWVGSSQSHLSSRLCHHRLLRRNVRELDRPATHTGCDQRRGSRPSLCPYQLSGLDLIRRIGCHQEAVGRCGAHDRAQPPQLPSLMKHQYVAIADAPPDFVRLANGFHHQVAEVSSLATQSDRATFES